MPDRFYLLKLIPPRPTFAQDMNDLERQAMQSHMAYWTKQLADGRAIVFGPVLDPAGLWGLGIIRVEDPAMAARFQAEDPAIIAGIGLRYEAFEMPRAIYKAG